MSYSRTDYEVVYQDKKGRPALVLPVVGFDDNREALVCYSDGELDSARRTSITHGDVIVTFSHVRPVGHTS